MLALKEALHCGLKVEQQMESVSNLSCLWGSTSGSISIGTSTIAANNFYTSMLDKPPDHGFGLPIGKHIYHLMGFLIDEQRAPSGIVNLTKSFLKRWEKNRKEVEDWRRWRRVKRQFSLWLPRSK